MNLLLDTNAWSYVAQEEALPELLRVSVKRKARLLIAPASVTEARAVKDPSRRKAVLAVMTDPRLTRLMPETFLESRDIKETLLAARPAWANPKPDASDFLRNRHYWRRNYFVTADKNFSRCVEKIQSEAPFKSAKVLKIRGGAEGLKELIEFCQSRA